MNNIAIYYSIAVLQLRLIPRLELFSNRGSATTSALRMSPNKEEVMKNDTEVRVIKINSLGGDVIATCCTICGAEAPCCHCHNSFPCSQCGQEYSGTFCPHCGADTGSLMGDGEYAIRSAVETARGMTAPVPSIDLDYPIVGLSEREDYLYGNRLRCWRSDGHGGMYFPTRANAVAFLNKMLEALVKEGILS